MYKTMKMLLYMGDAHTIDINKRALGEMPINSLFHKVY